MRRLWWTAWLGTWEEDDLGFPVCRETLARVNPSEISANTNTS
jgi:hypothetical protein